MKLNFDFTLIGLDGQPLKDENGDDLHAAKTAANLIMKISEGGPDIMVKFDWANELYKTGSIDLDKAGQDQFKRALETLPNIWLTVRGQLLEVLRKKKEDLKTE
jgi:hypothetical protein